MRGSSSVIVVKEDPNKKRWDLWKKWVEKNGKPKKDFTRPFKPRRTRFKKGVKKLADWNNFKAWVKIAALPKSLQPHYPLTDKSKKKRKAIVKAVKPVIKKPKGRGDSPYKLMLQHLKTFAKAVRRKCRNKHKYKPKELFKFSPFILDGVDYAGELKMKPTERWLKIKPTPGHGIHIPLPFLDREIEADFFRNLRFPVNKNTFAYKPTQIMKELINPDLRKGRRHCCKINPPKYPLPRQRMRRCHWTWHLLHLQYLALPRIRLDPPEPCVPPRIKVPLSKLKKRLNKLAKPRWPPPKIIKDRCKKKRSRRPPKPKDKFVYKPFKKKKGQKPNMGRIKKLAEPRIKYTGPVKIVKDRDKTKRKPKKMKQDDFKWTKRTKPADGALNELFNRLSQPKPATCSKSQTHDVAPENTYTPNIHFSSLKVATHQRECKK